MAKMPIAVLWIDLGKNSSSVAGLDADGAVVLRRVLRQLGLELAGDERSFFHLRHIRRDFPVLFCMER